MMLVTQLVAQNKKPNYRQTIITCLSVQKPNHRQLSRGCQSLTGPIDDLPTILCFKYAWNSLELEPIWPAMFIFVDMFGIV